MKNFDNRLCSTLDDQEGDLVIIRKGIFQTQTNFHGSYQMTKTATTQSIQKMVCYVTASMLMNVPQQGSRFHIILGGMSELLKLG